MFRLIVLFGLELYALLLAGVQQMAGVHTDEAKYLLNIPYPHPPLLRMLMGLTTGWTAQDVVWRIILATLLVQAVWLVWSMGRTLSTRERVGLCLGWLLSGGVVFQAGTVMLAPVTALQGLVFIWLYVRRDIDVARYAGWLSIFWGLSLFTAFQAVLYLPIVVALFRRSRLPLWFQGFCVLGPLTLLALYVAGHPLIAAGFLLIGEDNAALGLLYKFRGLLVLWGVAGSIWITLLGLAGLLGRSGALLQTFILLSLYASLSPHAYYAVLFVPVFIAGVAMLLRRRPLDPRLIAGPVFAGALLLAPFLLPGRTEGPARQVMEAIAARGQSGSILIDGAFGHEWQYYVPYEIRRYRPEFLPSSQAVICLHACEDFQGGEAWMAMRDVSVGVWVRR